MAVTGILLVLFLIAHMLGNLKIFTGEISFDHYAHWLRDHRRAPAAGDLVSCGSSAAC